MKEQAPAFIRYVFVCEHERDQTPFCGPPGTHIREKLKLAIKEKGMASKVRVSRSGCLDVCASGPNVLIMPDNIWFKEVNEEDVPAIVLRALEGIS